LEMQISKMEAVLANARIINESVLDTSKVLIHSTVEVKNQMNNQTVKYKLVAQSEADLASGKISVESPIGKGLLGKSVGEVAEITVPNGIIGLEVLTISRD
jgi:transcription elongation factor GreA